MWDEAHLIDEMLMLDARRRRGMRYGFPCDVHLIDATPEQEAQATAEVNRQRREANTRLQIDEERRAAGLPRLDEYELHRVARERIAREDGKVANENAPHLVVVGPPSLEALGADAIARELDVFREAIGMDVSGVIALDGFVGRAAASWAHARGLPACVLPPPCGPTSALDAAGQRARLLVLWDGVATPEALVATLALVRGVPVTVRSTAR